MALKGVKNGKPGSDAVAPSFRASNTVHNSGGTARRSVEQSPIAGPESPGQPIAMKRALAKKSFPGKGL